MITRQNDPMSEFQWNPATRFHALAGFVNDQQVKLMIGKDVKVEADRGTNHAGTGNDLVDRLPFHHAGVFAEFPRFLSLLILLPWSRASASVATCLAIELLGLALQLTDNGP